MKMLYSHKFWMKTKKLEFQHQILTKEWLGIRVRLCLEQVGKSIEKSLLKTHMKISKINAWEVTWDSSTKLLKSMTDSKTLRRNSIILMYRNNLHQTTSTWTSFLTSFVLLREILLLSFLFSTKWTNFN